MQTVGHVIDKRTNEKILVLVRQGKRIDKFCFVTDIRIRKSGKDGMLISENDYLNDDYDRIERLKKGEVVYC